MNLKREQGGFSLIELLIVVAIIGIISTIAVPQLLDAIDRGRQRRTMADMRNLATANGTFRVDTGAYAAALSDLSPDYMQVVVDSDAWGTDFEYAVASGDYTIESYGSDAADGPVPTAPWVNGPYTGDLELTNGQFTQAPTGQ